MILKYHLLSFSHYLIFMVWISHCVRYYHLHLLND